MSENMTPIDQRDPLWLTWQKYRQTEQYANAAKWATHAEHTEGSMWAAFTAGFKAAERESRLAAGASSQAGDR